MYTIVDSTTKKISKNYAVIDNVTRKINKIYGVVDGVTRLVWSENADGIPFERGVFDGYLTFYGYNSSSSYFSMLGNYAKDATFIKNYTFGTNTSSGYYNNLSSPVQWTRNGEYIYTAKKIFKYSSDKGYFIIYYTFSSSEFSGSGQVWFDPYGDYLFLWTSAGMKAYKNNKDSETFEFYKDITSLTFTADNSYDTYDYSLNNYPLMLPDKTYFRNGYFFVDQGDFNYKKISCPHKSSTGYYSFMHLAYNSHYKYFALYKEYFDEEEDSFSYSIDYINITSGIAMVTQVKKLSLGYTQYSPRAMWMTDDNMIHLSYQNYIYTYYFDGSNLTNMGYFDFTTMSSSSYVDTNAEGTCVIIDFYVYNGVRNENGVYTTFSKVASYYKNSSGVVSYHLPFLIDRS